MFIDFIQNLLGPPPEVLYSPETLEYIFGFIILIYIIKAIFSVFYIIGGLVNNYDD